ncbi:MAG: hypothetical protein Roseis2KO_17050 [Roseivirga sp.]
MSCGGGGDDGTDEPSAQELAFEDLAGTWRLTSIGVDGNDVTPNYPGFTLSYTETSYTTTNAKTLFRASGTWSWADDVTSTLLNLDDGKTITIIGLDENTLRFSFTQSSGGVVAGVSGNYNILMSK